MTPGSGWINHFPGLQRLPGDMLTTLTKQSNIIRLPEGSRIYGPGQSPEAYLLLLEGTGREIVLYRVTDGESCALTTACLMGYEDYLAEAIAETDVKAVAIARVAFDELIARSPEFRRFVFTAFSTRVTNLFRIIDEVAFSRMDIRLAAKLVELAHGGETVAATQQQLASEIGTAREVISRMVSEFQRRGWVSPTRGSIAITDRQALERLANS